MNEDKMLVPVKDMPVTMTTVQSLAKLPTTPDRYRNKPLDIWAVMLQGRELGLGEMTAMNNLILVNGQISMYAKMMSGLILSQGHYFKVEADEHFAMMHCHRWHEPSRQMLDMGTFSFTMEDAERAKLVKDKDAWEKYPAQMLLNRCMAWAARMVYADCISGIGYVPDEVGLDDEIPVADVVIDEVEDVTIEEVDDGEA